MIPGPHIEYRVADDEEEYARCHPCNGSRRRSRSDIPTRGGANRAYQEPPKCRFAGRPSKIVLRVLVLDIRDMRNRFRRLERVLGLLRQHSSFEFLSIGANDFREGSMPFTLV